MKNRNRWKKIVFAGILAAALMTVQSKDIPMATAWWGTLYPEYCYSQVPEQENGEPVRIRIKFRWLHGF